MSDGRINMYAKMEIFGLTTQNGGTCVMPEGATLMPLYIEIQTVTSVLTNSNNSLLSNEVSVGI